MHVQLRTAYSAVRQGRQALHLFLLHILFAALQPVVQRSEPRSKLVHALQQLNTDVMVS